MSQEILYTSAPRGLKPGSRGFCTVVSTRGMPQTLADRLESLSGYRHVWPPHDVNAVFNPVNFSHLIMAVGGRQYHVLSRIADCGEDYTQRSNKLAHHVALDEAELVAGGPAWVLQSSGFCETRWCGETSILAEGRRPPSGTRRQADYSVWKTLTGDAGWAGVLASNAVEPGTKPACVIFSAGTDTLALVEQALNLIPHEQRWNLTFSTYFTRLPAGLECQWRFVLDGTAEADAIRRRPNGPLLIDLPNLKGAAPDSEFVRAARAGKQPEPGQAPDMSREPTQSAKAARPVVADLEPSDDEQQSFDEYVADDRSRESRASDPSYSFKPPTRGATRPRIPAASGTDLDAENPPPLGAHSQSRLVIALASAVVVLLVTVAGLAAWLFRSDLQGLVANVHTTEGNSPPNGVHPEIPRPDLSNVPRMPNENGTSVPGHSEPTPATRPPAKPEERHPGGGPNGNAPPDGDRGESLLPHNPKPGTEPVPNPERNPEKRPRDEKRRPPRLLIVRDDKSFLDLGKPVIGVIVQPSRSVVGELQIEPEKCSLRIHGADKFVSGQHLRVEEPAGIVINSTREWKVVLSKDGSADPESVGVFAADSKNLTFEWQRGIGEPEQRLLSYCLLEISAGDRGEFFPLTTSADFQAPKISLRSSQTPDRAALDDLSQELIGKRLLETSLEWGNWKINPAIDGIDVRTAQDAAPVKQQAVLEFMLDQEVLAQFKLELKPNNEGVMELNQSIFANTYDVSKFEPDSPVPPPDPHIQPIRWFNKPETKREVGRANYEDLKSKIESRITTRRNQEKQANEKIGKPATEESAELLSYIAALQKGLDAVNSNIRRLEKLGVLMKQLSESGTLQFRVFYTVEITPQNTQQVTLFRFK